MEARVFEDGIQSGWQSKGNAEMMGQDQNEVDD